MGFTFFEQEAGSPGQHRYRAATNDRAAHVGSRHHGGLCMAGASASCSMGRTEANSIDLEAASLEVADETQLYHRGLF